MDPILIDDDIYDIWSHFQKRNEEGYFDANGRSGQVCGRGGRDDPVNVDAFHGNANFIDVDEMIGHPAERQESRARRAVTKCREPAQRGESEPRPMATSYYPEIIDLVDSSSDAAQDTPSSSNSSGENMSDDTRFHHPSGHDPVPDLETLHEKYLRSVREVFPNVRIDFLKEQYDERMEMAAVGEQKEIVANITEAVILHLLDHEDYPKEEPKAKKPPQKRKRPDEPESCDEEWTQSGGRRPLNRGEIQAALVQVNISLKYPSLQPTTRFSSSVRSDF